MASSTDIFLKWNGHHDALVPMLYSQLQKKNFVDVTIRAEGKSVNAHRLILCAASEYFEELLGQNHELSVVTLKNMKFSDVQSIIEYIYKGEVSLPREKLGSFLATATSLKIKGIAQNENSPDKVQEPILDVEIPTSPNLVPDSNMQTQVVAEEPVNGDPDLQMILETEENLIHQEPLEQIDDPDVVIVDQPPRPPPVVVNLDESMIEEEPENQEDDSVSNEPDDDSVDSDSSSDNEERNPDVNGIHHPTNAVYFSCGTCGRDYQKEHYLERHRRKGDCGLVPYFRCALCRTCDVSRCLLRSHFHRRHENVPFFNDYIIKVKPSLVCSVCSHRSKNRAGFRKHKRNNHNEKS